MVKNDDLDRYLDELATRVLAVTGDREGLGDE